MEAKTTRTDVPVPLMDVQRQYKALETNILAAVQAVCASGRYILGPDCQRLEERLAAYCGVPHAVACASGSDALLLALMAVDVGHGDEVIVPGYTFFATVSAVTRLGATPVFVDIEPHHFTLDPAQVAAAVSSRTKAIIPVHLFGQCAEMDTLAELAGRHGFHIVEDACQAIGAEYMGRRAGSLGHFGCFSFYPTKNLGCFGDGGLLTTNDARLADRLRLLRTHGMQPRYYHQAVGINSRLDTLQAAILNVKLDHLDRWTAQRRENAARYGELFRRHGLDGKVVLPHEASGRLHVWNQYVVRVPGGKRDKLREHLAAHKIGTEIYYPVPLHQQPCFQSEGYGRLSLPVSEQTALETMALPIFPELTPAEQETVVKCLAEFFGANPIANGHTKSPKYLRAQADREATGVTNAPSCPGQT